MSAYIRARIKNISLKLDKQNKHADCLLFDRTNYIIYQRHDKTTTQIMIQGVKLSAQNDHKLLVQIG